MKRAVESEVSVQSGKDLAFWLELALAYNPTAKNSVRKKGMKAGSHEFVKKVAKASVKV